MDGLRDELSQTNADIRDLIDILRNASSGNSQTVIHKSDGAGVMVGICIACVVILMAFIVIENRSFAQLGRAMDGNKKEIQDELRDVKAWNEVLRQKVAKLEAQQTEKKP